MTDTDKIAGGPEVPLRPDASFSSSFTSVGDRSFGYAATPAHYPRYMLPSDPGAAKFMEQTEEAIAKLYRSKMEQEKNGNQEYADAIQKEISKQLSHSRSFPSCASFGISESPPLGMSVTTGKYLNEDTDMMLKKYFPDSYADKQKEKYAYDWKREQQVKELRATREKAQSAGNEEEVKSLDASISRLEKEELEEKAFLIEKVKELELRQMVLKNEHQMLKQKEELDPPVLPTWPNPYAAPPMAAFGMVPPHLGMPPVIPPMMPGYMPGHFPMMPLPGYMPPIPFEPNYNRESDDEPDAESQGNVATAPSKGRKGEGKGKSKASARPVDENATKEEQLNELEKRIGEGWIEVIEKLKEVQEGNCSQKELDDKREEIATVNRNIEDKKLKPLEKQLCEEVRPTTVMLKNIPNDYSRSMLTKLMDNKGFERRYDFVYLPYDFSRKANAGYAFVNMVSYEDAVAIKANSRVSHNGRTGVIVWDGRPAKHDYVNLKWDDDGTDSGVIHIKELVWLQDKTWPTCMGMKEAGLAGFNDWERNSQKVLEVSWGTSGQGQEANVERYRNSPVMHDSVEEMYKPAVYKDGVLVAFPPPTRAIQAPRKRNAK